MEKDDEGDGIHGRARKLVSHGPALFTHSFVPCSLAWMRAAICDDGIGGVACQAAASSTTPGSKMTKTPPGFMWGHLERCRPRGAFRPAPHGPAPGTRRPTFPERSDATMLLGRKGRCVSEIHEVPHFSLTRVSVTSILQGRKGQYKISTRLSYLSLNPTRKNTILICHHKSNM